MSREKKKGTSGNAKAFITRAKALKKLQLSLAEFRRLCILKGIYPRDPRKKLEGSDKTYYLRKDIDFLRHERLIHTIRQENAHKKKEVKARAKRRIDILKRLALSKPKARLDHLVVERYPHFTDAIRELDDPLCVVALFANLPADHKVGIAPNRVNNCQRLLKEFHNLVAETHALKRCFVSIKGYYFQAKVAGELVTWVTPHRFSQILPADVDYSVMLTFLELYECILSFVNFRLYTSQNLAYPPRISRAADAKGLQLASVDIEKIKKASDGVSIGMDVDEAVLDPIRVSDQAVEKAQQMVMAVHEEEEDESDEENEDPDEGEDEESGEKEDSGVADQRKDEEADENDGDDSESIPLGVFSAKSFVLGREVPYTELEFSLKASGAVRVTRQDDLQEGSDCLSGYTHWIIDRPNIAGQRDMSLEYVQPQYVFDSINAGVLLPTSLYAPGANLPPHLSPFVTDEDDGGYRPWFKDVLERIKAGDTSVVAEAAAVVYAEGATRAKMEKERKPDAREYDPEVKNGQKDAKEVESEERTTLDGKKKKARRPVANGESTPRNRGDEEENVGKGSGNEEAGSDSDVPEIGDDTPDVHAEDLDRDMGEENSEDDDSEEDEEEEEERISKGKEAKMAEEGKEMAALMMSRKKMKQYKKQKLAEETKNSVKERLTAKRKQLESERSAAVPDKTKKKRRGA